MTTQTDLRQLRSRDTLSRITGVADSKADLIIRNLNSEITPPLAFSVPGTGRVLTIGNITQTNPTTGLNRTIPPISNLLPTFSSGTVTLSATGAGTATPSVGSAINLSMSASQFLKILVSIDATGTLTLTAGTPASTLAAATTPGTVSGLFAIGILVVRTDGSNNVANILTSDLYQFVGGGGNSGSGTGNPTLESIKNTFVDSIYELVTPNIIATDAATKINNLTGAAYDLITSTIKFTANSQVLLSNQMLDTAQFLSRGLDVTDVDLSVYWNLGTTLQAFSVPTAFTYEISRDGGNNWFTDTMTRVGTTNVFRGRIIFDQTLTTEPSKIALVNNANANNTSAILNTSSIQALAQPFVLSATSKIQEVVFSLARGSGTPTGTFTVSLIKDSTITPGTPSLVGSDILAVSNPVTISGLGLTTTPGNVTVTIPGTVVVAGTYHIVISTDAAYKAGFTSSANNSIVFSANNAATPVDATYNGSAWSAGAINVKITVNGRPLDLRVRITSAGSPTYPCGLDGWGIFYNLQTSGVFGLQNQVAIDGNNNLSVRDANGNFYRTIGSAASNIRASEGAGTTTLTISDFQTQNFNLTAARTVALPTANVRAGDIWVMENRGDFALTVAASGGATIDTINIGRIVLEALVANPTLASDWTVSAVYSQSALSVTFNTNGAGSTATTARNINITRNGRIISLDTLNVTSITPGGTSTEIDTSVALPIWARPVNAKGFAVRIRNNGANVDTTMGRMVVNTDGTIQILRDSVGTAFTNGAGAGFDFISVTYGTV